MVEWKQPIDEVAKEAFQNMQMKYPDGDIKVMQAHYESWAKTYDKDCKELHYNSPDIICDVVDRLISAYDKNECTILDLGAGTGLVGKALRGKGYNGQMTAVDYSQNMLDCAMKDRQIYNVAINHCLTADNPLPIEDEKFDFIVAGGAFGPNTIRANCLPETFRITRRGGYVILTQRLSVKNQPFLDKMDSEISRMIAAQEIEQLEAKPFSQYTWLCEEGKTEQLTGRLLVFRKL